MNSPSLTIFHKHRPVVSHRKIQSILHKTSPIDEMQFIHYLWSLSLLYHLATPAPHEGNGDMNASPRVIIVGAGASGIAAASKLIQSGISNVTILEAEDRYGGRVRYVPIGDKGVDLGAHWVHGQEGNVVYEMAEPLGLVSHSGDFGAVTLIRPDGSQVILNETIMEQIHAEIIHKSDPPVSPDFTLYDEMKEKFKTLEPKLGMSPEDGQAYFRFIVKMACTMEGCGDLRDVSALGSRQFKEAEGDHLIMWNNEGYNNVLELLMQRHEKSVGGEIPVLKEILFGKEVSGIKWDGSEVVVTCSDGTSYTGDHVVVTVSLGVLKEVHQTLFSPPLPQDKVNAIQTLGIDVVGKVYMIYNEPWWPMDVSCFVPLSYEPDGERSWEDEIILFARENSNPKVLGAWLVGDAAREMERESEEDAMRKVKATLQKRFVNTTINDPDYFIRSNWSSKHFRGSYSFSTPSSTLLADPRADLAAPLKNSATELAVMFAGEATHDHYFSTVHGAVESGWREALRLIKLYLPKLNRYKVAIIGAGFAGLGSASTLSGAGMNDFILLEAQESPGGRVRSEQTREGFVELGAQWIHGSHNKLYEIASKFSLVTDEISDEGLGIYCRENGEIIPSKFVDLVSFKVGSILEECEKFAHNNLSGSEISVGRYLEEQFVQFKNKFDGSEKEREWATDLFQWHKRFQEIDNSCISIDDMPADSWGLYKFSGGQNYVNFKAGFMSLVNVIAKGLPEGCLKTRTPVERIIHSGNQLEIRCRNGQTYFVEHVIVTCSLGYLKSHPDLFSPQLPLSYREALDCKGFDPICKIYLIYDTSWWDSTFEGIQMVWFSRELSEDWTRYLTGFDVVLGVKNALLGWVGSHGAIAVERISDEQVAMDCTRVLSQFLCRNNIPPPTQILRSSWGMNEFVLGGYSYSKNVRLTDGTLVQDVLTDPILLRTSNSKSINTIILAGEAFSESHFSTAHGAFESGSEQASKLLKFL